MDNLVLVRVVATIDANLCGSVLADVRVEGPHRFRMRFEREGRPVVLVVSLDPVRPWLGRPAGRWDGPASDGTPFVSAVRKALIGCRLSKLEKPLADRTVRWTFAGGSALVMELATHRANLLLLDARGHVTAAARRPPSARSRIAPDTPYRFPERPRRMLDPFDASAAELGRWIDERVEQGETMLEILRRSMLGVGTRGATRVIEEARAAGRAVAETLAERLEQVRDGRVDPVVVSTADPWKAAGRGQLEPGAVALVPWPVPSSRQGRDPADTAGGYYDALERQKRWQRRLDGLSTLMDDAVDRLARAERRARADLSAFEDPGHLRRQGEALLAGMGQARRAGETVVVPDPYGGTDCRIPAPPGIELTRLAQALFDSARRSERGSVKARERIRALEGRRAELSALRERCADKPDPRELEKAMRARGLPVGLEPETRAGVAGRFHRRPRLEGVRMFEASGGETILVGRSAKENHRLTFRLAAPHDLWFHAAGRPGAHVVLRLLSRGNPPDARSIEEAAGLAAWFSDGRGEARVDVHRTRRKNVRRPRGAPPGTVHLKRFETLRVAPLDPARFGAAGPPQGHPSG